MAGIKKVLKGLHYSFYVLSHPLDGFYKLRFEGAGDLISCILLLVFMVIVFIGQKLYSGFIFNMNNIREINALREIANVAVPVLLWCAANWSITALMDGKGRFADIFKATAYATMPYTVSTLVCIFLSRWMVLEEATFLTIITNIGLFLTVMLIFTGTLSIHQLTVRKTIFAIVFTVVGMVFIVFLAVLFASVIDKMIGYVSSVITEIRLRM